jgi:hypothetical protein
MEVSPLLFSTTPRVPLGRSVGVQYGTGLAGEGERRSSGRNDMVCFSAQASIRDDGGRRQARMEYVCSTCLPPSGWRGPRQVGSPLGKPPGIVMASAEPGL